MSYENIDSRWKPQATDNIQMVPGGPSSPSKEAYPQQSLAASAARPAGPWYNVKSWSKRTIAIVAAAVVIILIIVIVVPVETTKSRYPDYSALNYTLNDTFSGTGFFDNFDYFTGYDPTQGFVHYMLPDQAKPYNLTYASETRAVARVDNKEDNQTTGRYSVRLTSKSAWDTGLFIFDIYHVPYGCSLWPAIWTTSADLDNWPAAGEVDMMEAVNNGSTGMQTTLHTTDDCKMNVKRKESGKVLATNCYNGTNDNAGCGVQGADDTYGSKFNANGGGVMAMELREAGIRVWQFARSVIPSDITAKTPDPSTWGMALADFPNTHCDIGKHFYNQSIVIDIDVCGTWAGSESVYSTQDSCPGTCTEYAAQNKEAYDEAYFEFGNIWIYQAS